VTESAKRFVAIDGNSLLYRAFFAMRALSTTTGQPTNAIYGLTMMLLKILEDQPDYIAAAFDTPKPTFRHEKYDGYKAQRKAPPDDLVSQTQLARDLLRAFNISVVECPGWEADDVIGAMAKIASEQGIDTTIVTGDLDSLQLVDDHVSVMTTVKGVSDTVTYDAEAVVQRFGLKPNQMADFKGLKGDPSDNIPGVPGIGDKTASTLLQQFGTLENLLEHLDDLPDGKVKKALTEYREQAELSKHLATIVTDVPCEIDLNEYAAREPDYDTLRDLFVKLEFRTMLQRLPEVAQAAGGEERMQLGACRQILSDSDLKSMLAALKEAGRFAMHCHVTHEKSIDAHLIGLSFCTKSGDSAYVAVSDPVEPDSNGCLALGFEGPYRAHLPDLREVLESANLHKLCHDSKLAYSALALRGIELRGVTFDTMLAAYLLDSSRSEYSLGTLAFEQLKIELPGVTQKVGEVEVDDVTRICGEAEVILRLTEVMQPKVEADGQSSLLADIEMPLARILSQMELVGVKVDVAELESLSARLATEIAQTEKSIYEQAGEEFNIGSPKQLQVILFEKLGLSASKKTKTGYSTSAGALDEMSADYPIVADILRWRELSKLKSTYADSLAKLINARTGRIHTSLNQAVAATGRLSSSDPNLQNIPIKTEQGREIRKAFIASNGSVLLSADYSQIELRILAEMTSDAHLMRAFEADEDIHLATACIIFGCEPEAVTPEMRRSAKTVNFAVLYGMADFTLSKTLGIDVKQARDYIDTYFARFPTVKAYTESIVTQAREVGYVETMLGRRRYIPDIHNSNYQIRMFAERAAVNSPIQGTAADIIKLAMIKVDRALRGSRAKMLLQVHDELLFELPPEDVKPIAEIVRREMESAYPMRVHLKVDIKTGRNWTEMEPV
jgi:DNA polymerase-1